jgi:hypothetical protein
MQRDGAANTLALRNGTAANAFRVYNTFTDASNFERGFMRWNSNVLEIGTEAGGTGANRQVLFKVGNQTNGVSLQPAGTGVDLYARSFMVQSGIIIGSSSGSGAGGISNWTSSNYVSAAADPTTTSLTSGNWQVHRNTTSGVVKLWANNNGTLVSMALV